MTSLPGARNPAWRGGRYIDRAGYVNIYQPGHPRIVASCYVREHHLVAERAIGKHLPPQALVHHVDDDRANNAPRNLVICEDVAYHRLIHTRRSALRATGDVNARRCGYCHAWVMPNDQDRKKMGTTTIHGACRKAYDSGRLEIKNAARRRRKAAA